MSTRYILTAWLLGAMALASPAARAQTVQQPSPEQLQATGYGDLMRQTAVAIRAQNWPAAARAARAAFRAASSDVQRLNAARLVASAHFRAGQFVRAEWWLRRAFSYAGDGPGALAVRQDFARVRQANPLTVRLGFTAAPNSNVNNGSSSDTVTLFNLPFILSADAQALSGYEMSASAELRYRVAQSPDFATDIGLLLYGRTYRLSARAARDAPDIRGSDYAFWVAELLLSHSRNFAELPGPTVFSLNIGQNWYGGEPYTRYGRITVSQKLQLNPASTADLTAGMERQISLVNGGAQTDIFTISGAMSHRLNNRDTVAASLRLQRANSSDPGSEYVATQLGLNYGFAKPVMGTQLSVTLSAEWRDFDFSIYDIAGRHDVTLSAAVAATLVKVSYFGFSPTVSVEMNRTSSNVALFNRQTVALRFGLQSAF